MIPAGFFKPKSIIDPLAVSAYAKLVLWYETQEGGGATAVEEFAANNGTYTGVSSYSYGSPPVGAGIQYNLSSGSHMATASVTATLVDNNFTVCQWFYATDTSTDQDFFSRNPGLTATKGAGGSTGKIVVSGGGGRAALVSTNNYPLNAWSWLVYSFDGSGNDAIYVNNVEEDTAAGQPALDPVGSANFLVGGSPSSAKGFGRGNTGAVSQFIVFAPALTSDERTFLYNGGAGRTFAEFQAMAGA